jgi:cell division protein ZapE
MGAPVREAIVAALAAEGHAPDAAQLAALEALDALAAALAPRPATLAERARAALGPLLGRGPRHPPVRGLYLHGGVGRGKTLLMDGFFERVAEPRKLRLHFHRFMREVHRALAALHEERDPLARVADDLAARARLLCFDELFVSDIGDAMLLGGLFERLFARGVTLVATSNVPPSELYRDGLQRARFLPAIAALERHTRVLAVDGGVDYRLRALEAAELWHQPLDAGADASLARSFHQVAGGHGVEGGTLEVEGRAIPLRRRTDGVAWFDFAALCEGPRSAADYVELAREHHTVLVSGVPVLGPDRDDAARRFIALVDECYDRSVKLICSAAAPIDRLYAGERLAFEFRRAASRLAEMQSHEYLAREHRG